MDKEKAIAQIKKEYQGCAVTVEMRYSSCGRMKDFMGMMLYKTFSISF